MRPPAITRAPELTIATRRPSGTASDLFARRGTPDGRDAIVERYLTFARSLARRFVHSGQPLDDLVQVASIGLIKSIDRFDPDRGVPFESFALPTILGELKRHLRDHGWSVRIPRRLQERTLLLKDVIPRLSQDLCRSPSIAEIAAYARLSEEEVIEALNARDAYAPTSLDVLLEAESQRSTLSERISSDAGEFEIADEWVEFLPHLRALPERERSVLIYRYFWDWTQSKIAEEIGISQMHVSRLLSQSLRKLRAAVADDHATLQAV